MKPIRNISITLFFLGGFVCLLGMVHAQQTSFSGVNSGLEFATDVQAMMEALTTVDPLPFDSLPRNKRNQVIYGTFWSAQHLPGSKAPWPPLPSNFWNLDIWPLGSGVFILDDRNIDYAALQAEMDAAAALDISSLMMNSSMMMSSLSSSYAYSNAVYLTNLVVSAAGYQPMTASFSIGGGTKFVPWNILVSTNAATSISKWTWLGIGYTSYHYTFSNQPLNMAFYALAKPQQAIVLTWGIGSSAVPWGLTNAVAVSGGEDFSVALRADGTVTAWGNNSHGQTNAPGDLTNATVIVSGYFHSLALRADGAVTAWGSWYNWPNFPTPTLPSGLTNVVAISSGVDHDIAAKADGTVIVWGYTNAIYNTTLTGLVGVKDVAAGSSHNVALLTNGTVVCWGENYASLHWNVTNVPPGLSNVVAIAAGEFHTLALKADGTVVAWGAGNIIDTNNYTYADEGQAIVPAGLSNVVSIAAGGYHSLALKSDGTVVAWGDLSLPSYQLNQILGIGSGVRHALALRGGPLTPPVITSRTLPTNPVCIYGNHLAFAATATDPGKTNGFPLAYQWQFNGTNIPSANSNSYGFFVTDSSPGTYSLIVANAAGSTNVSWQVTVTNAINVTNDLLLIYNTNSADSAMVLNYYLAHRPMAGGANVLGLGYANTNAPTYLETITPIDFTNQIITPLLSWLAANPTKRPQYVILFMDLPSRVNDYASTNTFYPFPGGMHDSASVQLQSILAGWKPFITHLNMGMVNTVNRTNDCIGYIDKLASLGTNNVFGSAVISASAREYGNTNFVLDGIRNGGPTILPDLPYENYSGSGNVVSSTTNSLLAAGVSPSAIFFYDGLIISNNVSAAPSHPINMTNVAGYISWGVHSGLAPSSTVDGTIKWHGNSGWWLIETIESHNGQQYGDQGKFTFWYSANAFGGTNYSNTPIGAVSHTDEPYVPGVNDSAVYFGMWAGGKNFGICAWNSKNTSNFQAVGDPLIKQ